MLKGRRDYAGAERLYRGPRVMHERDNEQKLNLSKTEGMRESKLIFIDSQSNTCWITKRVAGSVGTETPPEVQEVSYCGNILRQ